MNRAAALFFDLNGTLLDVSGRAQLDSRFPGDIPNQDPRLSGILHR
jgi:hypothetical protein